MASRGKESEHFVKKLLNLLKSFFLLKMCTFHWDEIGKVTIVYLEKEERRRL
jgi:hypothetical protein